MFHVAHRKAGLPDDGPDCPPPPFGGRRGRSWCWGFEVVSEDMELVVKYARKARKQMPAEEAKIPILSFSSFSTGREPDILAGALQREYRRDGLRAEYRAFKDISGLRQAGLTLAVVKFGFLVDQFVTVLGVTDTEVIVGDPLNCLDRMTHEDFLKKWRFSGIVLTGH
jgi:hypothetical protein